MKYKVKTPYTVNRVTPRKKTSTRQKPAKKRFIVFTLCVIALCASGAAYGWHVAGKNFSDTAHYHSNSKYRDIQSRFVTKQTPQALHTIEYPIFKNDFVTKTVEQAIQAEIDGFTDSMQYSAHQDRMFSLHIGYQITHYDTHYVSVSITSTQDLHDEQPFSISEYWTFDLARNTVVTLKELMNGSDEGVATIIRDVREIGVAQAERNQDTALKNSIQEIFTEENVHSFLTVDGGMIEFDFGSSVDTKKSVGNTNIHVPAARYQQYLDRTLAATLFGPSYAVNQTAPVPSSCAAKRCVALTFDDGPSRFTAPILDQLKTDAAKATFFVVGRNVASYEKTMKRMVTEGHEIGNHSWEHRYLPHLSHEVLLTDLTRTSEAIQTATGTSVKLARPPFGGQNQAVNNTYREKGLSDILWSLDTRDWADRQSTVVCNRVIASVRPGAIILLHDVHQSTMEAMPCITQYLRKNEYHMVTVGELLGSPLEPGRIYTQAVTQ